MTIDEAAATAQDEVAWRTATLVRPVRTVVLDMIFFGWAAMWCTLSWNTHVTDADDWSLAIALVWSAIVLGWLVWYGFITARWRRELRRELMRLAAQPAITDWRREHARGPMDVELWRFDGARWRVSEEDPGAG